jgi:hypothetical protein
MSENPSHMSEDPTSRESELVEFLREIDVPAPERLRRSTEALLAEHERGRGGRRPVLGARLGAGLALGAAVAAVILVLVLVLGGSAGPSSLNVRDTAALTVLPPTSAAPPESGGSRRGQLAASVEGLAFPYWGGRLGWHASGRRTDRLAGRTVRTVFYVDGSGRRVGYAIVAGPAPPLGGGRISWRGGTPYHLESVGAGRSVVWTRNGHLCVVSGRGVGDATLLRLASWDDRAAAA